MNKLPVSFIKMKMQRNMRNQQFKVESMQNHFKAQRMVYHQQNKDGKKQKKMMN